MSDATGIILISVVLEGARQRYDALVLAIGRRRVGADAFTYLDGSYA